MRLCSFESPYGARAGAVVGEDVLDLNATWVVRLRREGWPLESAVEEAAQRLPASMRRLLARGEAALADARAILAWARDHGGGAAQPLAALALLPPVPDPGKVMGLKGNYRRPGPPHPTWFLKPHTALAGSGQPVCYPPFSKRVLHEPELAIVIGRRGRDIPADSAYDYVAGYTLMNDVTAMDLAALDDKWYDRSKGLDTFGPCGPWIVTRDELPDPHRLRITLSIGGEVRQEIRTAEMIYGVPATVAQLSLGVTLEPGDLITTGTTNTGEVRPGDTMEIACAEIGVLRSPVVSG
jgi:2-keto-4-pentenoate hydratase/2-oxohepta-3-ene-1,7-dioic acid hydratase in catechol pathway